jgi:hypothetical protein
LICAGCCFLSLDISIDWVNNGRKQAPAWMNNDFFYYRINLLSDIIKMFIYKIIEINFNRLGFGAKRHLIEEELV